jgi:formamidopyrimidine-DNA glycosylase
MPELPEVETVVRGLQQTIVGKKFTAIQTSGKTMRMPMPSNIESRLSGCSVSRVRRISKYVVIELDDQQTLVLHLGMSGRVVFHVKHQARQKHDHLICSFDDGSELVFNDARRFGLVALMEASTVTQHKLFANLGIEPLTEELNGEYLYQVSKSRKTPIKNLIMNANIIVGVGNIYACESLFLSGIKPNRPACDLSLRDCKSLVENIKKVLLAAIESGGSTLRDYAQSSGESGYFQHHFKVYGKEGDECEACQNAIIANMKLAGRSSFYCPECQKK